jgi:hypothetical protein
MDTPQLPEQLAEQLAALQSALLSAHPQIPSLLRTIHTALKNDPTNVTLLSEEQIATVVQGLQRQTATQLAVAATKPAAKKALKNVSLADL